MTVAAYMNRPDDLSTSNEISSSASHVKGMCPFCRRVFLISEKASLKYYQMSASGSYSSSNARRDVTPLRWSSESEIDIPLWSTGK